MLFNSLHFAVFFPAVLLIYHLLRRRWQNPFLVLASCYFYASWNWKFLIPLIFSTSIDYVCALKMEASLCRGEPCAKRRPFMLFSIVTNLGLLAFFKYSNFFIISFQAVLLSIGIHSDILMLNIILPIGISFYTFQALSYSIDVYRGEMHATTSFWDFFLALLFFPHLVAGPIQRASNLLQQIASERTVTRVQIEDGMHLILWGFFKKVVIADRMAPIANQIFAVVSPSGGETIIGVISFSIQIYCDFSGYTDIARGVAKLMGFELALNFNLPYFAINPSDFWKRWHISLSRWLKDYLYIPLGGNRNGKYRTYRNLMLTMVLGGLWHGAAWNFVLWGAYHGTLLGAHRYLVTVIPPNIASRFATKYASEYLWLIVRICSMFCVTCFGWLLFRATSTDQIANMTISLLHPLNNLPVHLLPVVFTCTLPLILVQSLQRISGRLDFHRILPWRLVLWPVMYGTMIYCIVFLGAQPQSFVYFQF